MMFSKLAQIAAWVALVGGVFQVLIGFSIANEIFLPYAEGLARYAPSAQSSGQVIDKGFYKILVAAAMGTLAEISFHLKNR
jgi:hypothetical protein